MLALKRRCLEFINSHSLLIECFEQASFMHALDGDNVSALLGLSLGSQLESALNLARFDEGFFAIYTLRGHHLPTSVRMEILYLIAHERLSFLQSASSAASGDEARYINTLYEALMSICHEIFTKPTSPQTLLFFNEYSHCQQYFGSGIRLKPFAEGFGWREDSHETLARDAKRCFNALLRGRNRRARLLRSCSPKGEFRELIEFLRKADEELQTLL